MTTFFLAVMSFGSNPFETLISGAPDLVAQGVRRTHKAILNFWATWCPPCREETPAMERLQAEFKGQGLEVIAVDLREDPEVRTCWRGCR